MESPAMLTAIRLLDQQNVFKEEINYADY